ncbi:ornithine cyclodeaminase family protein [Falsiroseomonas selenitidurans]|uniref:Ornithine cyclodeaminase family protein n=1 Tax=Falsiroseomonas selenitidurans TaxID=2716335 RepID=A0ABX1E939_9PROT|nr:ornithine cyclodeaminase family protein [Falsiroseomonas selenitidurans]NKC33328.1 ornithine cyclodeaminase family protein [Falsiroseomonas selenitidurans]
MPGEHPPVYVDFLNGPDIAELAMTNDEILAAIEGQLAAQGRGNTVVDARMHHMPGLANGHFNVLRGTIKEAMNVSGVKVVGDFVDNYKENLPSELATLLLMDPTNGKPRAILDASHITDMRTGAVTAIGAKYLARQDSKVLGHIGARGSSYWNVRLLDHLFDFEEIRVHSRRKESRDAFGVKLSRDLGKKVIVTEDWESCLKGADIMVEASRLSAPEPLFRTEWIKPGAFVCPYGTMSALELSITSVMDKMLMDDWGQARSGKLGAMRQHVDAGLLSEATLHAELGQVVAGLKPGRESPGETILLWHRGLSISDIALGHAMLEKARRTGIGQRLRWF